MGDEYNRLQNIASDSWYSKGVSGAMVKYSSVVFSRYLQEGSLLELGPAEGVMTDELAGQCSDYTVVEGSTLFCKDIEGKHPHIKCINALFEEFNPDCQYDNILLGHVLEHVINPVEILKKVKSWLSPKGKVLCSVPNANSIHRQAAVKMGLLNDVHDLNETDIHNGHRRVYDPKLLKDQFQEAGLRIEFLGGYWLKPVSNKQIDETWNPGMINAFMELGEAYPEIAAEIVVIARK